MFFEIGRLKPPCLLIAYFPVIVKGGTAVHFTLDYHRKICCQSFLFCISPIVLLCFYSFCSSLLCQVLLYRIKVAKCSVDYEVAWTRDTVYYDKQLVDFVQESADELGYSNQKINSGTGHNAQFASYMLPTTMIFVPSKDGHSHCEPELTSTELCTKGASVLLNAVLKCDNTD